LPELINRFYNIVIGFDKNKCNIRTLKIADQLFSDFKDHKNLKDKFYNFLREIQSDLAIYYIYNNVGGSPIKFNITTAMLIANFCLNKLKEKCPFFKDNSRKFIMLMFIALTLGAYKTKAILCNMENSKYYNKKYISNVSEYCYEFSKRMIIGYEEIIPALFLMLPQYIDRYMIDIIRVIKNKILKIKNKLETKKELINYFKNVILNKNNQQNGYNINFKITTKPSGISKKGSGNYNENNENNYNFSKKEEFIDPSIIIFKTDLNQNQFAAEIQKHLKSENKIPESNIKERLGQLREMSILIKNKFNTIPKYNNDLPEETNVYDENNINVFERNIIPDKEYNNLSDKKRIMKD
jgi:hypothetical protein